MTPSLLVDITLIPSKLAGLHAVVQGIAVAMLAFILPFTLVEMNVRGIKSREYPSYSTLTSRILTVSICLLCYGRIFSFLLQVSQMMSFAILSEADWGGFLTQTLRGGDSSFPTLSMLFHSVTSIQEIVLFISSLIAVTARDVIIMIQGCILSLLYAFGPIAIVCGVNQKSMQVTRGWIANSFQVAFWSFFLRLVVRVWLALNPMAGALSQGAANDYLGILTVNITFILLVLGTPIVSARLLSGENIAAFGEAAFGAVQTIVVARHLKAVKFIGQEVEKYKRAPEEERRSFFHHPIPATMTATYERFFGPRKKAAVNGK